MSDVEDFQKYLAAKKSVDDVSLNERVFRTMVGLLPPMSAVQPVRVLEIGAGIGTMLERLLERDCLPYAHYTAVERDPSHLDVFRQRLDAWTQRHGYSINAGTKETFINAGRNRESTVNLCACNITEYLSTVDAGKKTDLVIANALLDLVDIDELLPLLFKHTSTDGILYFTINFDGLTIIEPTIDASLDERILSIYHASMDDRRTAGKENGHSKTGRRLLSIIPFYGGTIRAAGSSDWVVYPQNKHYTPDQTYFLHYFIQGVHSALKNNPGINIDTLNEWTQKRHAQIDEGELILIVHQIDVVGEKNRK